MGIRTGAPRRRQPGVEAMSADPLFRTAILTFPASDESDGFEFAREAMQ
jgi:hypothetical protein